MQVKKVYFIKKYGALDPWSCLKNELLQSLGIIFQFLPTPPTPYSFDKHRNFLGCNYSYALVVLPVIGVSL